MKNMIGKNGRKAGMEYCSPLTQNVLNAIAQIAKVLSNSILDETRSLIGNCITLSKPIAFRNRKCVTKVKPQT